MTLKFGMTYVEDPKEYRRVQSVDRRRKNPIRYLLNQARYRAKKAGDTFTIEENQLEVPTHCPILGIPLFQSAGQRTDNSYSIDRIDNSMGYIEGNCRIISFGANMRKGDLTVVQVENLLAYMKREI